MLRMPEMDARIEGHKKQLYKLLLSERHKFAGATPSDFPESPGVYAITAGGEVLRAGKTSVTLRQRLYSNHLMGNQTGNLAAQLVKSGTVGDLQQAKNWIRANCVVSWLVIPDPAERSFMEHFMLSIVQPKFCDKN